MPVCTATRIYNKWFCAVNKHHSSYFENWTDNYLIRGSKNLHYFFFQKLIFCAPVNISCRYYEVQPFNSFR